MKKVLCFMLVLLQGCVFCLSSLAQADTMTVASFEWSVEAGEEESEQTQVLNNTQQVTAFLSKLAEKGWQNQSLTGCLEEIAPSFFEENRVIAVYDLGFHGGTYGQRVVTHITVKESSATIYYAPAEKPSGGSGTNARWTVLVQLVFLPRGQAENCTDFQLVFDRSYWGDAEPTGDLDGNQIVDAADALYVLQAAVNKWQGNDGQRLDGDMDQNGRLDAMDALLILQKAVGK